MTEAEKKNSGTSDDLTSQMTADQFVDKLRRALQLDGDFPASAKVVGQLRMMVSDPKTTANQITEVILREPSLGTRVLHLVNSSFYRRAKPIMTVSQAVIQIGMKPLAELCANLVLLQKFVPMARRGGPFATCLQKTVLTSTLSSSITKEIGTGHNNSTNSETGYLAGSFYELGTLLLAFYFPQVYENALKRSERKKQDLAKSIQELTGLTKLQLSLEVIDALDLPDFYREVLLSSKEIEESTSGSDNINSHSEGGKVAKALFAAKEISDVVVSKGNKQNLEKVLQEVHQKIGLEPKLLNNIVGNAPAVFKDHCSSIDLELPALPEFVSSIKDMTGVTSDQEVEADEEQEAMFTQFVEEIREAVEGREPTSAIITTVMETFAWSLNFDRVLLMLVNRRRSDLVGRMLLGAIDEFDPKTLKRPVDDRAEANAPDALAFRESRPVFNGNPVFEDGWPIATIPIGFGQRAIGVIYADRVNSQNEELTSREQAAIGVLAELLDRSVGLSA